ncbi:MAG: hypothetical protein DMC59_08805 [Verrucomicrobia bacterium]|nr:MAG: hypothetical protein DMC59_08805 [Verrucomicrobiota bacterium]PYL29574.1 MAG: hypothetical protein DMF39_06950 [Verrucomicrobiota bacterium]
MATVYCSRTLGSALILSAGDRILRSRTSVFRCLPQSLSHLGKSSSPQNAATSTLQACAPRTIRESALINGNDLSVFAVNRQTLA